MYVCMYVCIYIYIYIHTYTLYTLYVPCFNPSTVQMSVFWIMGARFYLGSQLLDKDEQRVVWVGLLSFWLQDRVTWNKKWSEAIYDWCRSTDELVAGVWVDVERTLVAQLTPHVTRRFPCHDFAGTVEILHWGWARGCQHHHGWLGSLGRTAEQDFPVGGLTLAGCRKLLRLMQQAVASYNWR